MAGCAQRLSASEVSAPAGMRASTLAAASCSTPFGIRGLGTARKSRIEFILPCVLNAFRHQRSRHLRYLFLMGHGRFVLNAFRHQRSRHTIDRAPTSCVPSAQRLSASEVSALTRRMSIVALHAVLNAFRHQRSRHSEWLPTPSFILKKCSTPFGIRGLGTGPGGLAVDDLEVVLNAFRHQRSRHSPTTE